MVKEPQDGTMVKKTQDGAMVKNKSSPGWCCDKKKITQDDAVVKKR